MNTNPILAVITGANSGIGKAAALQMAQRGDHVVMVCRSRERGEAARQEIVERSQNQQVDLMLADLSSQASIRRFTAEFKQRYERLNVLINNAANFDLTLKAPQLTAEGHELIWATNHLGPFLMTHLLLDVMHADGEGRGAARIINVASMGLKTFPFLKIDFEDLHFAHKKYSPTKAYYQSKLAQIMFTFSLARKLAGTAVTANVLQVPSVKLDENKLAHFATWQQWVYKLKSKFSISPAEMAAGYVRLATDPVFASVNGEYLSHKLEPVKAPRFAYDEAAQARLWDASERQTELQPTTVLTR